MTRTKICGLTNRRDAELAIEHGADALGFVFEPSSPRCIRDADFISNLAPYVEIVGVFASYHPAPFHRLQALQSIDWAAFPESPVRRIKAVRLRSEESSAEVVGDTGGFAAVLLDAFSPNALGGTGEKVDWDAAANLVRKLELPVILAGGLTPGNVADAIAQVNPYAVDVSSGVEAAPGRKDPYKLRDFLQAVRSTDNRG